MKRRLGLRQQVKEYSPVTGWAVSAWRFLLTCLGFGVTPEEDCRGTNANVLEEGRSTLSNPPWQWEPTPSRGSVATEISAGWKKNPKNACDPSGTALTFLYRRLQRHSTTLLSGLSNNLKFLKGIYFYFLLKKSFFGGYVLKCSSLILLHWHALVVTQITKFTQDRRCSTLGS